MPTKRIEYIDAMRGFTMMLVVYSHIVHGCFHLDAFTFNKFFHLFRMPLFFFISGWVMYKATRVWDTQETLRFLGNKFMVQIIPTAFFLALFIYTLGVPKLKVWYDAYKLGYWFTFMLFQYFLFYVSIMLVIPKRMKNTYSEDAVVLFFGVVIAVVSLLSRMGLIHSYTLTQYIGSVNWYYFLFFCFGTLVKKHFDAFIQLTDNKWFMAVVVITTILLSVSYTRMGRLANTFSQMAIGAFCIVIILTFFRKNESHLTKDKRLGNALQYIGRRTLDIYLLHYFFLPVNLHIVGKFFKAHNNPTVEFFVSMVFALMVIACSLTVSNLIRLSPFLAKYLFGVKEKKTA